MPWKAGEPLTDDRKHSTPYQVIRCAKGSCRNDCQEFIGEEPLLIRIDQKPYAVVMRMPGEELLHAAGFCLGEGIVNSPDDFTTIGYCQELDPNVIDIRLKPERSAKIQKILGRRGFVSQTSCGICGKELIEDLHQSLTPVENSLRVGIDHILECLDRLSRNQRYYQITRGSHAAMILDKQLGTISFAEDVGRHNALDKAIGTALMNRKLQDARIVVLSSRISYELVQKAARARLPIMVSISRPTALATDLGKALNMTIACADKTSSLIIACGEQRIVV